MDAWQKGGTFEGKKATDELVLKFWKERADGVSKDDPLHDTYQNTVTQLDYTIHESKLTAQYSQGKATDAQMISFYLGWAKKVPQNSEFYRVLQRDAGQYMRNQKATSEAKRRQAEETKYQTAQADTRQTKEAAGEYAIDTLRRIAQSGYANGGLSAAIAAPGSGSDLTDFDPSDPDLMLKLIDVITGRSTRTPGTAGPEHGNQDVIFHDDNGKAVTGADIMAQFQKLDPNFKPGTPFNVDYVTGLLNRQMQGLNERIKRATDTGHMTDVTTLQKSKAYVATLNREVAAYPVQKAYEEARADYDSVVSDKSSSPQAVLNAWQTYQSTLLKLSSDPRIAANDAMRSQLVAEADGKAGEPTLHESFTGLQTGAFDPSSAKDSAENAKAIEFMQQQVEAVQSGQAVWTYGKTDANGVFVPQAGGREIGAATPDAIEAGGTNAQIVMVPDPRGGTPLRMAVTAVPVYATATDPATGKPISPETQLPVAYAYDLPSGAGTKTLYGFQTSNGFVFSEDAPWDKSLKVSARSNGGNHLEVDMTPIVAQIEASDPTGKYLQQNTSKDGLPGAPGWHVQGAGSFDAQGNPKAGQLTFNPLDAVYATDTRSKTGGLDPQTDFFSLTLASLMGDGDGRTILSNLDKNPAFKAQMDADAYGAAGYQQDLKTGSWVPGANADPSKLGAAQNQQFMASAAKSFADYISNAAQSWQRAVTGSAFKSDQPSSNPQESAPGFAKLATDLVQGTPFEALGKVFLPGTSTLKTPEVNSQAGFTIQTVGTIKTPAVNAQTGFTTGTVPAATSAYTPPPAATGPVPGQTSSQSGSEAPTPNKRPGTGPTAF